MQTAFINVNIRRNRLYYKLFLRDKSEFKTRLLTVRSRTFKSETYWCRHMIEITRQSCVTSKCHIRTIQNFPCLLQQLLHFRQICVIKYFHSQTLHVRHKICFSCGIQTQEKSIPSQKHSVTAIKIYRYLLFNRHFQLNKTNAYLRPLRAKTYKKHP